jgi:hypothetical protein
LTPKGWKALDDIRNRAEMLLETQLAPLSKTRREKLGAALRILEGSFQKPD